VLREVKGYAGEWLLRGRGADRDATNSSVILHYDLARCLSAIGYICVCVCVCVCSLTDCVSLFLHTTSLMIQIHCNNTSLNTPYVIFLFFAAFSMFNMFTKELIQGR